MENTERVYESKIVERQLPLVKVETIIDNLYDLLGFAYKEITLGKIPRNWETIYGMYNNLYLRTHDSIKAELGDEYVVKIKDNPLHAWLKMKEYITILKMKNIYKLGNENFSI
jgi:hypothetical protein